MKKLLLIMGVAAVVLAFGTISAEAEDRGPVLQNGVTIFEAVPEPTVLISGDTGVVPGNGVTIFEAHEAGRANWEAKSASGSAAGGMSTEGARPELYNGVTVFFESGPGAY